MRQRRETVEHPFGTIKARMGATHFLMKTLKRVSTEMALHVLAYNLTRVILCQAGRVCPGRRVHRCSRERRRSHRDTSGLCRRLVAKLRAARERKRQAIGKCEGRKNWAEINPELVREAKRLCRRSPKGHQRSLRDVAAELAKLGFVNQRGAEFSASSITSIVE
jgi:hypothetical protein